MLTDAEESMIVSLGGDRTVTVTDVATGATIGAAINISDDEVTAVALRSDGHELPLGGSRQIGMQIWDLDPDYWVDATCRVAGRNLLAPSGTRTSKARTLPATCPEFPVANEGTCDQRHE